MTRKLILVTLLVLLALPNLGCPGTIALIVITKKRMNARRAAAQAEKDVKPEESRNQTTVLDKPREKEAPEPATKAPETATEAPVTRSEPEDGSWKPTHTSVVRNAF